MTAETAQLLARAIKTRDAAAAGLKSMLMRDDIEIPPVVRKTWETLGTTYVHEQRIINRIIEEDRD